jgi:hypothetical protein
MCRLCPPRVHERSAEVARRQRRACGRCLCKRFALNALQRQPHHDLRQLPILPRRTPRERARAARRSEAVRAEQGGPVRQLGGQALVLVVDDARRFVRIRVVERVERVVRPWLDDEVGAAPLVADADGQLVGGRLPEERDLEAVVGAVGELTWRVIGDCDLCDSHFDSSSLDFVSRDDCSDDPKCQCWQQPFLTAASRLIDRCS